MKDARVALDRVVRESHGSAAARRRVSAQRRAGIHASFGRAAHSITNAAGSVWTFVAAIVLVLVWLLTGPLFGFSQSWQLVINTGTTIVTFLMVFVIQHAQNRETRAIQLKLDELIFTNEAASNRLVHIEVATDDELEAMNERCLNLVRKVDEERRRRVDAPSR
jgi:low affinity Fe/Cu permease